jgi:hypothetical protein
MNPCFEDFMFVRVAGNNAFEKFDVYRLPNNDYPIGSFKLYYKIFYKIADVGEFHLFDENDNCFMRLNGTDLYLENVEDYFKEFCTYYKEYLNGKIVGGKLV